MHLSIKSSQHAQLWSKLPFNVGVDFEKVLNVSSYLKLYIMVLQLTPKLVA